MSEETFDPTQHGWDEPERNSGVYLRLANDGDSARIRIVSQPYKFTEEVEYEGKKRLVTQRAFVVIHKEMVGGQPHKSVKAFKAGAMIYGLLFDLAKSPNWGNPMLYDVLITRTGQKGKFYTVQPIHKGMGEISESERQMVIDANLNLESLFNSGSPDSVPHPGDDNSDPFADE